MALALGLQRRLNADGANVRCFAADPGEVLTDITRTLPPPLRSMYRALLPWILFTPAQGALRALTWFAPDLFGFIARCYPATCSSCRMVRCLARVVLRSGCLQQCAAAEWKILLQHACTLLGRV